ncbi:MAG: hypothetical protein A2Y17_12825 [Clostridiales bacterium GWF2_38_85]|nr:MAG: hypothetical protein A2Y17_12825 [Clostridiales bacterium GWF2_38_85]
MNYGNLNLHNIELTITAGLKSQLIQSSLFQIALSGRSNVGKSSLINTMLGRKKLARVSGEPGKTITVNYYNIDKKMFLVDLPGYGFASRPFSEKEKWAELTEAYFAQNDALKLVLQLVDIKVGLTPDDITMLEWMNFYSVPYTIVATKSDKLNKTELSTAAAALAVDKNIRPNTEIMLFSSLKGYGRDELWSVIIKKLSK